MHVAAVTHPHMQLLVRSGLEQRKPYSSYWIPLIASTLSDAIQHECDSVTLICTLFDCWHTHTRAHRETLALSAWRLALGAWRFTHTSPPSSLLCHTGPQRTSRREPTQPTSTNSSIAEAHGNCGTQSAFTFNCYSPCDKCLNEPIRQMLG